MPADENQEISYVAPASAPESGATAASEDADTGTQVGSDEPAQDEQEPKTFTQEELDKIVQERVAKAERKARRELEAKAAEAQRPANYAPPDRNQFPAGDAGDQAFWNASVDYTADLKVMQREQQKQEVQTKTVYQEREESVREKYPDFTEVTQLHPSKGGPAITPLMADVIYKSEYGPEIAYHLGKNVNESHRIYEMDPIDQVREMTKLEVKMAGKNPAKKVSSAPEPIKPIAGAATTHPKYGVEDPRSDKTMSHAEWIAQRNKTASR